MSLHQPVLDANGHPLDQIRLIGLSVRGRHGVLEHERRQGQAFELDVVLHLDTREAAAGDRLAATVDYGRLAVAVGEVVRGEPVELIETLAQRVAMVCLSDPRVTATDVTVHKPGAPIAEVFRDVLVTIRRYQDERHRDSSAANRPDSGVRAGADRR